MRTSRATRLHFSRDVAFVVGLVTAATMSWPAAATNFIAANVHSSTAMSSGIAPSALLTIDQNRTTVVDRVVADWGDALASANAGLSKDQLQALLTGLRSDQLLAASLAGSLEGLRNVISTALVHADAQPVASALTHAKALGDASIDLVYTPVAPCRLADTRVAGGQFAANTTRDFKVWVSSGGFTAQGGNAGNCNVPANPAAVALNLTAVTPAGSGWLTAFAAGGTFPDTSVLNYQSGTSALANGAIIPACVPNCTNQVSVNASQAAVDVVIDIVGYFKAPGAPIGTVSNIATGPGLTGGPITSSGTIGLAPTVQNWASQPSCAAGTVLRQISSSGSATCASDANSGGTVTSIAAGTGLTGGTITSSGTIGLGATVPNWTAGPPSCANGDVITSIAANGTATCEAVARAAKSGLGYAWVPCTAAGCSVPTSYSYNSTGQPITAVRSGIGNYSVTFTGLTALAGGHVQVTAYGSAPVFCKSAGWSLPIVYVVCFNSATGAAADSDFNVLTMP